MTTVLLIAIVASFCRLSIAPTVLSKVTLPRSCFPIVSSPALAFAIALSISACTSRGVFGQCGIDEDFVRLLRGGLKIRETFDIAGTERKSEGGEQTDEQEVFHRMVDGALNIV